ncbi:hypothetical protein NC652_020110 [Populus alba x Populus x berolinensis]|nr:hypothetical protein NC652_020110 [Populus alba x Populus x berolinensis]
MSKSYGRDHLKGIFGLNLSIDKLQVLMRACNNECRGSKYEGKASKGRQIRRFSPRIVSGVVTDLIENLLDRMI